MRPVDPGDEGGFMKAESSCDAIVIGAGIAGLCAADRLVAAGRRVVVLDKARGVGGRMATRRLAAAVCDHGAQFFTVRGDDFGGLVTAAAETAAVTTWCAGFVQAAADGSLVSAGDGHARWRGVKGMTDLPKWLAARLAAADGPGRCAIRTNVKVTSIAQDGDGARLAVEGDQGREEMTARGVILTAPVPQALDMLRAGGMLDDADGVATDTRRLLETVTYDPCFALMLVLDRPTLVPPPGGMQFPSGAGPIAWLADNLQKGISPVPALTVHATGGFSRDHFDAPPDEVARLLLDAVRPWIDGDPATAVVERSLHRWKFAQPTTLVPDPLVVASAAPPVVCCGDAFAGPRVEGAAASGLAAGRWLARTLS
jgi:predicted NAD/FAD-dependent oxidoreductase